MKKLTYLQDNLKDERIIRWPENCFPLKFYVAPFRWYAQTTNDSYKYQALVHRALEQWENISGGKVKFKIVPTLNESQVNLDWKRVDRKALGHCYFHFDNNGRLYSAEVQIGLSDGVLHRQYQDENEVYHTILHEIGHALGLGHSTHEADIMYTPHKYGVVNLSQRDAASIQWLYKLPYGISIQEMSQRYGVSSNDIDEIIAKISNAPSGERHSDFEDIKNSIRIPQKDLMSEQDKLAELKKYNLGLQNIQIPQNVQEYIKKNLVTRKTPRRH